MSRSTRGPAAAIVAASTLAATLVAAIVIAPLSAPPAQAAVDWTTVPGARADDAIVTPYNGYLGRLETPGFSYNARGDGIASYCSDHPNPYYACPADFSTLFRIDSVTTTTLGAVVTLTVIDPAYPQLQFLTSMDGEWEQTATATTHGYLWHAPLTTGAQQGQSAYYQQFCQLDVPCTVGFSLRDRYGTFYGDQFVATHAGGRDLYIPLHPVTAPTAAFTATASSASDAGQFQFVSSSSSPSGDALTSAWDFGDGSASTAGAVTHSYTVPGAYHVTLTVTDQSGLTGSVTHDVVVAAPRLTVTATVQGRADTAPGAPVAVDVFVAASADGVGALSGLRWDAASPAGLSSAPVDALTGLSAPSPALPNALAPGQSTTVHFTATAGTQPTTAVLTSAVDATDAAGTTVTASGSVNLKIAQHALTVTVTPATNPLVLVFDANGAPVPQDVPVDIVVTNTALEAVDGVSVGPLDLAAADPAHPSTVFPARVLDPNVATSVGTLAAGASSTVTRTVHVTDFAELTLSDLVTSTGDTVLGTGGLRAGLPNLSLSWTMDERWDGTPATIIADPDQLTPKSWGFTVTVTSGCGPSDADDLSLTIGGAAADDVVYDENYCRFHFTRPNLDRFTPVVTLTRSGRVGATGSVDIVGRDFLVVAVGDSLSSGEGQPAATWSLAQCDRSVDSGSGIAAYRLERADPHTSVDYVSLACSGASTAVGLVGPYDGIQPGPTLEAQLRTLQRFSAVRPVDSVVFSIGANDLQFGDVVAKCITLNLASRSCGPDSTVNGERMEDFLARKIAALPTDYAQVNQYLSAAGITPDRVVTLTYPDSTHSDTTDGVTQIPYCSATMSQSSWQYSHNAILEPLNGAIEEAAARYGWRMVGGAEQAFLLHGYCSSDPWITTIVTSLLTEFVQNGGFHPNSRGYIWYGDQIYAQLDTMLNGSDGPAPLSSSGASHPVVATGTVSAGTVDAGSPVTVTASGFAIDEDVSVTIHSTPVLLATTTADSLGALSLTVTVPQTTPPGAHDLILIGSISGNTATIPIVVTAGATTTASVSSTTLPATGREDPRGEFMVAGAVIVLGVLIRLATRQRRSPTPRR